MTMAVRLTFLAFYRLLLTYLLFSAVISNGELFQVLKMMVGSNLNDVQLQQIVDKTILEADLDKDGKISFDEFVKVKREAPVARLTRLSCDLCPASLLIPMFFFFFSQMISNTDEI